MHTADIEYSHDDLRLVGHLAVDDSKAGKRPAVLIAHDAGGIDELAKRSAVRLAELGYVALALDYYGEGKRLDPAQLGERFGPLAGDPLKIRAIGRAGLEALLATEYADASKVAAIGYCFGGTMALELARSGADLAGVVGFHSGLSTSRPGDAVNIKARVLVCIGAEDPIIPPEQRLGFEQEMRAGGVDWQMNVYGGAVHSFTNPDAGTDNPALAYDEHADEDSWRAMLQLFSEVF
ncbi:MAG: dienelactone hydrolase [Actinomycetia bacterium]|nr:dienelactone hydrolase [Actinomycetes bacterium]